MNTPIEISSLTEYISQIDKITHPEKNYLYRGQENVEWQVTSSAYRRLIRSAEGLDKEADLLPNELRLLCRNYLIEIVDEVKLKHPSTYRNLSQLECMAHLQHNHVATGLIDFTFNPLVALWFACADESMNGRVVMLENNREKIEEITTIEKLQQELETLFLLDQEKWHLWSPSLDSQVVGTQRMIMQQSVFLFGLPEVDTEMIAQEIVIPGGNKARLQVALAKVGISEKTLFSDLLGFFERNTVVQPYRFISDRLD